MPTPSRCCARRSRSGVATTARRAEVVAVGLNNLASILRQQGRLDDAVPLLEQAIAIRRQRVGNGHPALAQVLGHLGPGPQRCSGDFALAEPLLREALAIRKRAYGDDHPDTDLRAQQPHLAAARPGRPGRRRAALSARRWRARRSGWARGTPTTPCSSTTWPRCSKTCGAYDEAERLLSRIARHPARARTAREHPAVARAEHNLGRVLLAHGAHSRSRGAAAPGA